VISKRHFGLKLKRLWGIYRWWTLKMNQKPKQLILCGFNESTYAWEKGLLWIRRKQQFQDEERIRELTNTHLSKLREASQWILKISIKILVLTYNKFFFNWKTIDSKLLIKKTHWERVSLKTRMISKQKVFQRKFWNS